MVSLSSTFRTRLFAASLLLMPVLAFSAAPQRIRAPKIDASFEMPDQKAENPIVVDDATKAKLEELAKTYGKVARDNYPLIIKSLHLEKMATVRPVKILVTYKYNGVAATTGSGFGGEVGGATILVSAKYALGHPKDLGMVVHEMVHVVQSYPTYDPGWLVEGIADWVRWFNYEKVENRPHPNPAKANARAAYQTTAAFLFWASEKYDKDLVPKLSASLQANTYKEEQFKTYTGKTLDELNTEWVASLQK